VSIDDDGDLNDDDDNATIEEMGTTNKKPTRSDSTTRRAP
jgi:hypothetical protein